MSSDAASEAHLPGKVIGETLGAGGAATQAGTGGLKESEVFTPDATGDVDV